MSKKILMGLAPLLAVAAFAVMPAMASAATAAYGTCSPGEPQEHPPCPEGEKTFTALTATIKVLSQKAVGSGIFVLTDTVSGAKVECEGLINSGTMENVVGVGKGEETLILHHCSTKVGTLTCRLNTAGAGDGVIVGTVTDEVITETTVKVTVKGGFALVFSGAPPGGCPAAGTAIGTVTGTATGTQAEGSHVLVFTAATGLKLGTDAATITGSDETYTEAGKPVLIGPPGFCVKLEPNPLKFGANKTEKIKIRNIETVLKVVPEAQKTTNEVEFNIVNKAECIGVAIAPGGVCEVKIKHGATAGLTAKYELTFKCGAVGGWMAASKLES